jgi:hypothetical protein
MWSSSQEPFNGIHYHLGRTLNSPQALSAPHPPILIGGGGEKKTLRLVAKYADACNLFGSSVADVKHKLEVLRGHCDAEGRDYDAITKTIIGRLDTGDPVAFLREMEEYAKLGIDLVEVAPAMPDPAGYVAMLGEKIVRPLAEIG